MKKWITTPKLPAYAVVSWLVLTGKFAVAGLTVHALGHTVAFAPMAAVSYGGGTLAILGAWVAHHHQQAKAAGGSDAD